MRRYLGYALSVVTGYLCARHLHALDAHWAWYQDGPSGAHDDPLAFVVFVLVSAVGCWVIYQVTPSRRRFEK
jgi:H+/Cl- antiporter ClcA